MMRFVGARLGLLAGLLGVLALSGAGCGGARIRRLSDEQFRPRPRAYPIQITEGDYEEAYLEVAEVTTQSYEDRRIDVLGRAELRSLARKLGGDAVIRVSLVAETGEELAYRPGPPPPLGTRFADRYRMTGIVVRFVRKEQP